MCSQARDAEAGGKEVTGRGNLSGNGMSCREDTAWMRTVANGMRDPIFQHRDDMIGFLVLKTDYTGGRVETRDQCRGY